MGKIDKTKLFEGIKLLIWCNEIHRETIVTISYRRLNVIFFTYDEFPDKKESWLPTGSYIVEKAIIQN